MLVHLLLDSFRMIGLQWENLWKGNELSYFRLALCILDPAYETVEDEVLFGI